MALSATKILEQSLITNLKPQLNSADKVAISLINWSDEFLQIYDSEKEYKKVKNYHMWVKNGGIIERKGYIGKYTLNGLETRHGLNKVEVLNNLNTYHVFKKGFFKSPVKIIPVDEDNIKLTKLYRTGGAIDTGINSIKKIIKFTYLILGLIFLSYFIITFCSSSPYCI